MSEQQRGIRITATDLETGESNTVDIASGDYMLVCAHPCYLDRTQRHSNGTVTATIKSHRPTGPSREVPAGESDV